MLKTSITSVANALRFALSVQDDGMAKSIKEKYANGG